MANTVEKNRQGPIWVLGNIANVTPGTPVNIMSLVDPGLVNDPNALTTATANEYTVRAYEIIFQAQKAGATGTVLNTGNIYILKRGAGAGSGNRNDYGILIATIPQGAAGIYPPVFRLTSAPVNRNSFNPYDILIDADTALDGCQVTLVIQ